VIARSDSPLSVLFLGAAYGVVLGMRIAAAGHRVTFTCREREADLINQGRLRLRIPAKGSESPIEIGSGQCAIPPRACTPGEADPAAHDLVILAMSEPQYGQAEVRELVLRLAAADVPCLSIMNMPLPPFLHRLGVPGGANLAGVFSDAAPWSGMDPKRFTMASADPQAIRLPDEEGLLVKVTLPTNFKVAPFDEPSHQGLLQRLADDIDATRIEVNGKDAQPRVRLVPHPSRLVPLAKWPMLITGNFRCLGKEAPISIRDAVCRDVTQSRDLYEWVQGLCEGLGVESSTLVPFEAYRAAAEGLTLPSSLARGLHAGATAVERVDRLIQALALHDDQSNPILDRIVEDVDARLLHNRSHQRMG